MQKAEWGKLGEMFTDLCVFLLPFVLVGWVTGIIIYLIGTKGQGFEGSYVLNTFAFPYSLMLTISLIIIKKWKSIKEGLKDIGKEKQED
jgi:hypothetical protein